MDNRAVGLDFRQQLEIALVHLGDLGFDLAGPLALAVLDFADVLFTIRFILRLFYKSA